MGIFRVVKEKSNPYVVLNKGFLNDESLSFRAKGILAYLLSKPDNWQVYQKQLERASKDGRERIRAAVKELIDANYIMRTRRRTEDGRFAGWEYAVHEVPKEDDPAEQKREKFLAVFAGGLGIDRPQEISPESKRELDQTLSERME